MQSLFKLGILFSVMDRVSAPARTAGASIDSLRGRVAALGPQFEKFQLYGKQVAVFGMVLMALLAGPMNSAKNFEYSMSQVGAVSQATTEQMAVLEKAALSLGSSTAFSASQVAQGQKYLAMAGMDTQAIIASMPDVLNLASAAQTDLGRTANISTNILSAFGLKATEMNYVGDVLTRTFTSSNTTLESLSATMANAAPVAHAAGVKLHELAAMAGKLGDVGIDASVAGTSLKIMIQRLQAPTGNAAKTLQKLGVSTTDVAGNMLPLLSIMSQLETATAGMGSATRAANLKEVFGEEAIGGVTALLQTGVSSIEQYSNTLATGPVTSANVATQQMNNMQGALTTLKSATEGLSIVIGKQLMPVLIPLLLLFAGGLQRISRFATEHQKLTQIIIIGVSSVALLAFLLGSLAAAFGALALVAPTAVAGLSLAFPVVAAIGAASVIACTDILEFVFRLKDATVALLAFSFVAGQEVLKRMASGIMVAGKALMVSFYNVLLRLRAMMPYSDARTGPLSQLTLAGKKIILTIAQGVQKASPLLVARVRLIFQRVRAVFLRFNAMLASVPVLNWLISHMGTIGGVLAKLSGRFTQTGAAAVRSSGLLAKFGRALTWLLGPMKLMIAAGSLFYYVWSENLFQIQERLNGLVARISAIDFAGMFTGNISIAMPDGLESFYTGVKTFFYGMGVELARLGNILSGLLGPVIVWLQDAFQKLFALFSGDGQSSMEGLGRAIVVLLGLPIEGLALVIRAVQIPVSLLVDSILAFAGAIKGIENPLIKWGVLLGAALLSIKGLAAYTSLATIKTVALSTATGLLSASQGLLYPYSFLISKGLSLFGIKAKTAIVQTKILTAVQSVWGSVMSVLNTHVKSLVVGMLVFVDSLNFAAIKTRLLSIAQTIWASSSALVTAANSTMAGSFTALTTAMSSNPIGAIVVGLVAAAAILISYWEQISNFFKSLDLFESGKKIVMTLTNGILSAGRYPYEALLKIFSKMRELLPFSDAKIGPLSRLTLSGKRIITTISDGLNSRAHVLSYRMRIAGRQAMDSMLYAMRRGGGRVAGVMSKFLPSGLVSKGSSGFFVSFLKATLFFAKRFIGILAGPVGWVITAISIIHSLFSWNILGIRNAWGALWSGIGEGMSEAWSEIKAVFGPVVDAFNEAFAPIGKLFGYIKNLLFGVGSEFNWLKAVGKTVGYAIVIPFKAVALVVRGLLYPFELLFKAIAKVNEFFANLNFFEAGRKLLLTFVDGIKSVLMAPVNMIKSAFSYVRDCLPFSDAKQGPLSDLTLSGSKILTTLSVGVQKGAPGLNNEVNEALGKVNIPELYIPFSSDFPEAKSIDARPEGMSEMIIRFADFFKEKEEKKETPGNNFYIQSLHIDRVSDLDHLMEQLHDRVVVGQ